MSMDFEGKVYIEPDYTTISKMKQRQETDHTQTVNLERLKEKKISLKRTEN